MIIEEYYVPEELSGQRLDKAAAELSEDLSRSLAQKLIEEGKILTNGMKSNKKHIVYCGDRIEITRSNPVEYTAEPEDIPLEIEYEDRDLLVVNKPKGMVTHPAPGNYNGTLVNALLFHCKGELSGINGVMRPGIVHRIDKETSGLLIVAKNDYAHKRLAEQIQAHSMSREYEAIIVGKLKTDRGTINAPIGRHPIDRKKMTVTQKNSKEAITHYELIESYSGFSRLRLRLETGRTHQIRAHMAYLGHPVAGDTVYGGKEIRGFKGQCLHAKTLGYIHPRSGEEMFIDSELPEYFKEFIKKLENLN